MEQIKRHLELYQQATSREERTAIVVKYQAFLETLPTDDRDQARHFMQKYLRPKIEETVKILDALTARLMAGKWQTISPNGSEQHSQ